MSTLEIILAIISIVSTIGTFYYGIKSAKLSKEKQRFSWSDITEGCRYLNNKAIKRFKPDIVLCFSGPSSIIANLIIEYSDYFVPIFIVEIEKIRKKRSHKFTIPNYQQILTSKWRLHIPQLIFNDTNKIILIVDDSVISGDSITNLKNILISKNFKTENVHSCSLICTDVAKQTNKAPDVYCYLIRNTDFYLPWGKGY